MMATSSVQVGGDVEGGVAQVGSGHRIGACFEQCRDHRGSCGRIRQDTVEWAEALVVDALFR